MGVGQPVSLIRPVCPFEIVSPHKKRKSDDFHLCNVVVIFFFFPANSSVPVRKTALSYTI